MPNHAHNDCKIFFENVVSKAGNPYFSHCEFVGEPAYSFLQTSLA